MRILSTATKVASAPHVAASDADQTSPGSQAFLDELASIEEVTAFDSTGDESPNISQTDECGKERQPNHRSAELPLPCFLLPSADATISNANPDSSPQVQPSGGQEPESPRQPRLPISCDNYQRQDHRANSIAVTHLEGPAGDFRQLDAPVQSSVALWNSDFRASANVALTAPQSILLVEHFQTEASGGKDIGNSSVSRYERLEVVEGDAADVAPPNWNWESITSELAPLPATGNINGETPSNPFQQVARPLQLALTEAQRILDLIRRAGDSGPVVRHLSVRLHPEDLGQLNITLRLSGDNLDLKIDTESDRVARSLDDSRSALADLLKMAGTAVEPDRIEIRVCPTETIDRAAEPAKAEGFGMNGGGYGRAGKENQRNAFWGNTEEVDGNLPHEEAVRTGSTPGLYI